LGSAAAVPNKGGFTPLPDAQWMWVRDQVNQHREVLGVYVARLALFGQRAAGRSSVVEATDDRILDRFVALDENLVGQGQLLLMAKPLVKLPHQGMPA
jgi:hypothetical protein